MGCGSSAPKGSLPVEPKATKPAAKAPPSPPLYTKADLELPPLDSESIESNAPDRSVATVSDEPKGVEATPPPAEPRRVGRYDFT